MTKLVIFGVGKIAQVAHACLSSQYEVVGFTVDAPYLADPAPAALPVVDFAEVERHFPPDRVEMFVALGYHGLNRLRTERFAQAQAKGYRFVSWVSPKADVGGGAEIGDNCLIMGNASLQPLARIGNGTFVWSNAVIGHHAWVGEQCWITAGSVVASSTTIGRECFVGANATITHEVTVGDRCLIGAGVVVAADAAAGGVYIAAPTERFRLDSERFLKITKLR